MPPSVAQSEGRDEPPPPSSSSSDGGGEDSIKVAIRFRPLNTNERKQLGAPHAGSSDDDLVRGRAWQCLPGPTHSVAQRNTPSVRGQTLFSFDEAYDETVATPDVFDGTCRAVVDGAMGGIDGTIFAYGQTGSGKTYTMQGPDGAAGSRAGEDGIDRDGIVQMAARCIFRHIESAPDREFLVRTSFVEVYNEVVRDLLQGEQCSQLAVRDDPKRGGVHMDCREVIVTDFASLMDTISSGELNRMVASTDMNAQSSRSHAIFRITVESREARRSDDGGGGADGAGAQDEGEVTDQDDRAVLVSTLNLVDLAGSESVRSTGATGQRQKEGGKINQSLLCLSQVINALSLPPSKRPKYINYRDSKLTRILRASLSGNARMAILCCASPSTMYVEETRSALKFASRAKMVQTKAKKNEVLDDGALIRKLQRELSEARKALAAAEVREDATAASPESMVATDGERAVAFQVSSKEEREKLTRLKSMILHGGGLFGSGQDRRGDPLWRQGGNVSPRKSRAQRAQSLNPAVMTNALHSSAPMPSAMQDLSGLQRQQGRCSVGVLQVAHHIDSDVLMQIYEEVEGDSEHDGGKSLGAEANVPEESTLRQAATWEAGVGYDGATDNALTHIIAPNKSHHVSSETDILREALKAKNELVLSLQLQLTVMRNQIQSLEERIRFVEQNQSGGLKSALTSPAVDDKDMEEELKWCRLKLHSFVVIASSLFLFWAEFRYFPK